MQTCTFSILQRRRHHHHETTKYSRQDCNPLRHATPCLRWRIHLWSICQCSWCEFPLLQKRVDPRPYSNSFWLKWSPVHVERNRQSIVRLPTRYRDWNHFLHFFYFRLFFHAGGSFLAEGVHRRKKSDDERSPQRHFFLSTERQYTQGLRSARETPKWGRNEALVRTEIESWLFVLIHSFFPPA